VSIFQSYFSQPDILGRVKDFYLYSALLFAIILIIALLFLVMGFDSPKKSQVQLDQEKNIQEIDPINVIDDPFLNEVNSLGVK
jgi:hypothetical protein